MGVLEDDYETFLVKRCSKLSEKLRNVIIPNFNDALPRPDLSQDESNETEDDTGNGSYDDEAVLGQEAD